MAKRKSKDRSRVATASSAPQGKASPKPSPKAVPGRRRALPNWPLLALALLGMALTAYLAVTAWLGETPAYCTEGSSCDLVQSSRWGSLLGLPMAAWGLLGYTALGYVAFRIKDAERHWQFSWLLALVGVAVSVYLTVISVTVVGATCTYCLISLGLMTAILAVVTLQRPAGLAGFSWPAWGGQTALLALLIVGALHLHYSGWFDSTAGPEDPYLSGLAQHLTTSGAQFYGAYW